MPDNIHPAVRHMRTYMSLRPDGGKWADLLRASRREPGAIQWPDWCFLPMSAVTAIVTAGRDLARQPVTQAEYGLLSLLTPALAWRPTQDIIRFDEDVYEALCKTPPADDAPDILFRQLPAWCVYIELHDPDYHGAFVHLEYDVRDSGPENGREELRILFVPHDPAEVPVPQVMHLGHGSIQEGLAEFLRTAERNLQTMEEAKRLYGHLKNSVSKTELEAAMRKFESLTMTTLSLVLYLCSSEPEWGFQPDKLSAPHRPEEKKVKGGWRLYPPDRPRIWNVGAETGIKIRSARSAGDGTHKGPRPHIRRAHWHTYWTGRRVWREGETPIPQTPKLTWLAPVAVAMQEESDND